MVALFLRYINSSENKFKEINVFRLVCGYSYFPPDQVFGRTEHVLKKKVTILTPDEYYDIYSRYGRLKLFEKDFQVYDYKHLADLLLKKNCLQSRFHRRLSFKKKEPLKIFVSTTFCGGETAVSIVRPKFKPIQCYKPVLLSKRSFIKPAKKRSIQSLLSHFSLTPEQKSSYDQHLSLSVF